MAVKYTKRYTNEAEYILDVAKGSDLFRADAYDALDSEQSIDYSYAVAGTKNRTSDTFNMNEYDMLGAEDKYVYLMNEYYADKNSDEYSKTKEYLDYKLDEAKAQMTYESLSGLEKTLNNIGGILGNATNMLLFGTIEGLIDMIPTVIGQTDFVKKDITGYSRNTQKLQEFNRAYTDLDKKGVWRIANDVTSGLIKMAPLALNGIAPGVGSAIYFGSMAGNTAEETLKQNPDIDYLSLIGYTATNVGLEFATEKLSGAILGRGTAIDNLFNKAKGTTAGSWISHIGLDFLSEGLEESISEFGNEVLHAMIINKDQPFAEFDMMDILYAGLVGGLIGGVSAGARIARTQKQVILEDGSVMSKKEADALNLKGKVLGKAQSLNLMEAIAEAQDALSNTAESKLIKKYSQKGESINSIKSNHAEEYQKALDTDAKHQDELVKTALGLTRILQMSGPARFEKAVKIAEYTVEKKQELIRNYKNSIANLTGLTAAQKQVAKEFQTKTGYSIDFKQDLNVVEKSIQNKLKNEYGINVQFGYLGKLDGVNTYHAATLNEKTIILDADLSNTMSLDSIIDQIVKEELVHTLQYASGILTKKNMQELMKTYHSSKSNVLRLTETDLDRAYASDSDVTKISERQAKALAQVLLFDELSVSKMFMTNRNIISRVYHWLKGLRDNTKKQGIKNRKQQVKFNTILKSMRMYQNAVASKITNTEDLTTLAELFSLDSTEQQYIYDRISEDPTNEHFTLMKMQISITSLSMSEAQKMLEDNFVTSKLGEKITNPKGFVATLLNPETYNTEFVEKVMSANPGKDFRYNLQAFLINNYNVSINERYGVLTETVDLNSVTTPEFRKNLENLPKDPDALSDYWKLSEIFNDDFNAKFPNRELDDIELIFNVTDKANPVKAEFGTDRESQTKYIKVNIPEKGANVSQIAHALYHETTHALATLMDLPNGTSTVAVKRGLSMATPNQIKFLADKLLTKDFYNENKNNTGLITDYLAYAIYRVTDGEYAAEMYKTSAVREGETDIQLKSGHNLNTSGFYVNGNVLQGYGVFKDIALDTTKTDDNAQLKSAKLKSLEGLIKASEVVSYSKTNELARFLKEKGLSDYQKAGFSESFEGLLLSGTATKTEIRDLLSGDLIGTPKATNAIIEWLYPDNKHLKTIEDVKEILTPDKNGFSLLTFGLVYGKALANVEGNKIAPNDPSDIKEGVMKTPLIDNKNLFAEVDNIIHSHGNDNYIIDKLLSMDFDFSIKQSTELLSALEKSLAWQADQEYVPAQTGDEGEKFDITDIAVFKEYNEAKYNPKGVKEEITAKWKRVTSSEVRKFKDSLADWMLRKHKGASDSNELDVLITRIEAARKSRDELDATTKKQLDRLGSVDLIIDAMNSVFNTLDNTEQVVIDEEKDTTIKENSRVVVTTGVNKGVSFNVSGIYDKGKIGSDEKITFVRGTSDKGKKIAVPISDVEITTRKKTTTTNHFDVRNKLLNNEEKLVTVFGEKGYEKLLVELKKHVPTSKQNLESKVNSRIKNIESRSDLTLKEKAIVGIDRSNFTPKDYEKYIGDLDKIVSRETSTEKITEKEGIDELQRFYNENILQFEQLSWKERITSFDENLRKRFAEVLQRRMDSRSGDIGDYEQLLNSKTGKKVKIYTNVDAETFYDIISKARTVTKNGELVDVHDIHTNKDKGVGYVECKNFLSADGLSGFSITPKGDLISVFSLNPEGGWLRTISPLVKKYAKTLDCYVSDKQNLQEMYFRVFGFKTASIMDWNDDYDHDDIGNTHNKPKVAFMVNVNKPVKTKQFNKDDYDNAKEYQMSFFEPTATKTIDEIRKEALKTDEMIKEVETVKETPKKEITPEDEEIDKEKYKEQAGQYKTIKIDNIAVSKSDTLIKLMTTKEISDYQGEFDNPEYIKASRKVIENNEKFFESITSGELLGMFKYLQTIEDDFMSADAAYNILMRYAYEPKTRATQFKDISEFIKTKNKRMATQAAQFMGGLSVLYGTHHITKLLNSVAGEKGYDLQIPEEIMMKFASEYAKSQIRNLEDEIKHLKEELDATKDNNTKIQLEEKIQTLNNTKPADSIDGFVKSLETEIDNLREKLKNTKDPWTKKQLNHEIDYKVNIMETIQEGDFAEAADLITTYMQDNVTHVDSTEDAISGLYEDIVKWLIALPDVAKIPGLNKSKQQFLSDAAQKKLTDTLSVITSIRYMAMLSNPVTGLRNAVVNTGITALNRVEMRGTKWLENTKLLDQPSQIRITGDFDANFSNHVDELFGAKFKELLTGNKYDTNEIDKAKRKYAEEKDPINKSKILKKIKELESKMLSDTPWTYPKAMKTLKNSLAGSRSVILAECLNVLYPTYLKNTRVKDRNTALLKSKITDNPKMRNLVTKAIDGDLTATIDLAMELKLDIMNIDNENSIPYYALYKSNELFLKTSNWATKLQTTLAKNHPGAAAMVSFIAPFMRVSVNSLGYIINRSPIALAKGVLKACQTRAIYLSDMKESVVDYYKNVYKKSLPKDQKYDKEKFTEWYSDNVPQEVQTAVEKGGKQIKEVYDKMSEEGKVNPLKIGADDRFLRTESLQELSQGIVGTSLMVLGCVLAAATDAFDYDDDDDYLGAIIRIGDLKIALEDLSPFSTMFTVGAMLSSGNIDNKMDTIFEIIADASFLGIIDSAVKYSDSFKSYLENQFINSLTQYIPALTKNIRKSFGTKKDKSGTFGEKLLKTLASNTMLFAWLVPNKVNPYTGEPDKYYESGVVESLIGTVSPIGFRLDAKSKLQREAEAMKAETQGLTGRFTVNGDDIVVTGKDKENLAKYRAKYIQDEFAKISSGKQLVTVEDANGKRITTTYNKLSSEQKNRVLKNLYSKASDISKIKYWTDKGNYYVVTDRKLYNEYSELFKQSQLLYKSEWSKSKFVER